MNSATGFILFMSAWDCSEIACYCAGLCVFINIDSNIIVLAAAC